MRIGQLAKRAKVNIQTIRFYEREGIIKPPLRLASGYRDYSEQAVELLELIKQMQGLGFTLKEIREIFSDAKSERLNGCEVEAHLQEKIDEVEQKIATLNQVKNRLVKLRTDFAACICLDGKTPCPDITEFTKKL
jgi:MerR family mercuric resistance operon transcriptional regulator